MRRAALPLVLIGTASLTLVSGPVLAQQSADEKATSKSADEPNPPPAGIELDSAPASKKADILFAPVPFSSPSTGAGLAGGVIAFYNPNNSPQQWISGGGIVWTNRGTKGIAAFHSMSLNDDGIRIKGEISYFDEITKFYGIGEADGDRGKVLELQTKSPRATVEGQFRIFPNGYAGLRFRFADVDAAPNNKDETSVTLPPPVGQMNSTMSMIGPTFSYDTRDSSTQPHEGVNINAIWLFGRPTWGDSFEHDKFTFSGSFYLPAGEGTVFAMNGTLCGAGGDVPYYDLCMFGSHSALRGYPSGRYRDRASWSTQAEVRHQFAKRWGAVVFMGLGGIAPSLGDVASDSNLLPAAGAGLRYRPFKENDVNLRVDVAFGKNDTGVYLSVGEAF